MDYHKFREEEPQGWSEWSEWEFVRESVRTRGRVDLINGRGERVETLKRVLQERVYMFIFTAFIVRFS